MHCATNATVCRDGSRIHVPTVWALADDIMDLSAVPRSLQLIFAKSARERPVAWALLRFVVQALLLLLMISLEKHHMQLGPLARPWLASCQHAAEFSSGSSWILLEVTAFSTTT